MFFLRHVLPIIVLSGIIGFAVVTIMQRPLEKPDIKMSEKPPAKAMVATAKVEKTTAVVSKKPVTSPKPVIQPPKIPQEVQRIEKPITDSPLKPEGISVNITEAVEQAVEIEVEPAPPPEEAVASAENNTDQDEADNTEIRRITVKAGDLLSEIAHAEYGRADYYHAIYAANQETLTNANVLTPGQTLIIPTAEQAKKVFEERRAAILAQ